MKDVSKGEIATLGDHLSPSVSRRKGNLKEELKVPLSASVWGKEAKFSSRTTEFQNPYEINNIGITILQMRNLGRRQ